jgi:Glycine-rich domain-containing protein-like
MSGVPRSQPRRTHLARYIASAQEEPSWNTFIRSFAETVKELKAAGKFRELSRGKLLVSIRTAYMGIMWPQLSIDLVAAALRQREFATKITSPSCAGLDTSSALYHSNTRYHKFLLLMKRSTKTSLVPTLDIDLSWHTHQLHPIAYRDWCVQNLGVAVNHDDTIGEGDLAKGLRETSLAWHDAYKEGYTTDNVRKSYWSPGRVAAGVLFPPYGLYMLNKGNKLPKGPPPAAARGLSGTTNRDTSGFGYGNYYPYMFLFPYGLAFPIGYYYAAGCAPGAVCIGSMVPSAGACGSCMGN